MKVTAGAVLAVALEVVASHSAAQTAAATDMTPTEAAAVLAPWPAAAAGDGRAPRAVCCAVPAKTPARAANEPPDGLKNFTTSEYYSNKIHEAVNAIPPTVLKRCAVMVETGFTTKVLAPVTFGGSGLPNGGSWEQSFLISGCGSQSMLTLHVSANKNEPISVAVGDSAHDAFPWTGFYSASHQVNVEGSRVQVFGEVRDVRFRIGQNAVTPF